MSKLPTKFYARPALKVARELLGKTLVRKYRGKEYRGIIFETEAYGSTNDPSSHAFRGKTERTSVMFGQPGQAYVYFIYGMYFCFNVVTEIDGKAGAVLIRGVIPFKKHSNILKNVGMFDPANYINGPGKLCNYFHISKAQNKLSLQSNKLWIENINLKPKQIKKTPRIGIKEVNPKFWRFVAIF
ncbi:MAG: DNA-3-methyladenine glycosylase [bacterium]